MCEIMVFPQNRRSPSKFTADGPTGQILFFTGVRRERRDDAGPPSSLQANTLSRQLQSVIARLGLADRK
ncbi:hypothetical protein [Labrys monachus]|uniref:Uncharacterized protein n=1 Tax=Labrys monachus TaxID=217067 RepID=A0ABU0F901_9HYPH|nr:hypothetical protein [Labrys monachus]MDQ0391088.1 hypothetical protein [Labrys monachus]